MVGIYIITCKTNGKSYIGQSINLETRWQTHKCKLRNGEHINKHLQYAWNKYGENNFTFEVLLECEENKLDEYEEYYIFELMTYDRRIGYNIAKGGRFGKDTSTPIVQMDEYGNVIAEYKSISEAGRITGANKTNISLCCSGKQITTKGYRWAKKDDYINNNIKEVVRGKIGRKGKPIIQLDLEGNFIAEYPSITEAEKAIKKTRSTIGKCLKGIIKKSHGYKWEYKK